MSSQTKFQIPGTTIILRDAVNPLKKTKKPNDNLRAFLIGAGSIVDLSGISGRATVKTIIKKNKNPRRVMASNLNKVRKDYEIALREMSVSRQSE